MNWLGWLVFAFVLWLWTRVVREIAFRRGISFATQYIWTRLARSGIDPNVLNKPLPGEKEDINI